MIFSLKIKPLSINAAWQGRRFKTAAFKQYEKHLNLLLPKEKEKGDFFRISYRFFLKHVKVTDADNLVKVLQDCIVKKGIIKDDRMIVEYYIRKFSSTQDRIEVEIEPTQLTRDWKDADD